MTLGSRTSNTAYGGGLPPLGSGTGRIFQL